MASGCVPPPRQAADTAQVRAPTALPPVSVAARERVAAEAALPPPDAGGHVRPCLAESPDAGRARSELEALSKGIAALAPAADPKPWTARLARLLDGACFALIRDDVPTLEFDSSLALRTFWANGGEAWAAQVLHYGDAGPSGRLAWLAPSPRKSLTLDTAPRHALAPILCGERDAACGSDTAAWQKRADTFFTLFDRAREAEHKGKVAPDAMRVCAEQARQAPPGEEFHAWRGCFEDTAAHRTVLPLGRYRAPRAGWLVVRGRRGHYAFCDEVRAYDLDTGAAYMAKSCSGLALRHDGSVDGAKTDAARQAHDEVGRVSVDALREAAWMALLAPEAQEDAVVSGFGWHIPDEISVSLSGEAEGRGLGMSFTTSTGQTGLAWTWLVDGKAVRSGELTWPEDYDKAAREHAVRLLDIAETTFAPGCPPAAIPSWLGVGGKPGAVSPLDAGGGAVRKTQDALVASFARLRGAKTCRTP